MTISDLQETWTKTKALWPGWGKSIEGPHEQYNVEAVFKMFRDLDAAAVNEAVDQHFAEKGTKKNTGFEPAFPRILELAKFLHFANRNADPMKEIHQTYVSMLPKMVQLEREVEWHRRMAMDDSVNQQERERHSAIAALGNARLTKANTFATQEAADKCRELEAAQIERANKWKREAIEALHGRTADDGVREHVRSLPPQLSKPSGERKKQSQAIGQVWR